MNKIYQTSILNNQYAPGIATYGIDGKDGERGNQGTSLHFTTYNLEYSTDGSNEVDDVLVKINQNKILSQYVDKTLDRSYVVGDLVMDSRGYLYSLYTDNDSFKLKYVTRLTVNDSLEYFQLSGSRVILTKSGLDLSDDYQNTISEDTTFPLRLFSKNVDDTTGRNNLLSMVSRDYDNSEKYLNIFYDKDTDSFHFETESAIVFDTSAFYVNESDDTVSFTDYYKIEPYNNPLGLIHKVFSKAEYEISTSTGLIQISNIDFTNYSNMDIYPEFLKIYTYNDVKTSKSSSLYESFNEYIIPIPNDSIKDSFISVRMSKYLRTLLANENINYKISLVKGIEVFITKKETEE